MGKNVIFPKQEEGKRGEKKTRRGLEIRIKLEIGERGGIRSGEKFRQLGFKIHRQRGRGGKRREWTKLRTTFVDEGKAVFNNHELDLKKKEIIGFAWEQPTTEGGGKRQEPTNEGPF